MQRLCWLLCLTGVLAACQSTDVGPRPAAVSQAPVAWVSDFPLREIGQMALRDNQCGLALWARNPAALRIFYAANSDRVAHINLEGVPVSLPAKHQRKNIKRGFSKNQHYSGAGLDLTVDIDVETRDDLSSSAVVRSGLMNLTRQSDGRALVVPVVGMIGCAQD